MLSSISSGGRCFADDDDADDAEAADDKAGNGTNDAYDSGSKGVFDEGRGAEIGMECEGRRYIGV